MTPPQNHGRPHRIRIIPRTRRGRLLAAVGAAVGALAIGFAAVYFLVLGTTKSPAALTLGSRSTSASASTGATLQPAQVAGVWKIGSGSVAGYRVREKLGFLPAPSDAVGRTSSVTGSMTVAETAGSLTVSAAAFTVDVSTLTSDRAMRDNKIHTLGLESDRYPQATFTLTAPVAAPVNGAGGQTAQISATGQLTIHGVTRTVTIPMKAQLAGSSLEAVGSLTFPFSQFGMEPPSIGSFVSVEDNATMEFDIHLTHA